MDNPLDPAVAAQEAHTARRAGIAPVRHRMEIWLSYVLRVGVLIAGAIIAIGLALLFIQGAGSGEPASLHALHTLRGCPILVDPAGILAALRHLRPRGVPELRLLAVTNTDGMTADWYPLQYEVLGRISNRMLNHVPGINRVVYDITSKPPGTIEWE